MGALDDGDGHAREPSDDAPCHHTPGLDPEKKTLGAAERDAQQRQVLRDQLTTRTAADVVIVDERGTNLNLTPRYARAPRGQRAYGQVPRTTPPTTTVIAALTTTGMGPAMTLRGATDTAAFAIYVTHFLPPSLRPGHIVVMDNLSAQKNRRVRAIITARGCERWYLPSYSPHVSPIEEAFSKLNELLRRAKARTHEALENAIALALDQITAADARGYFTHCGYQLDAS